MERDLTFSKCYMLLDNAFKDDNYPKVRFVSQIEIKAFIIVYLDSYAGT